MYRPEQRSFLDLQREELLPAEAGTVIGLLVRYRAAICPTWLTRSWTRGSGRRGRKAWPVETVLALLVLRWSEEGTSRVAACRRARTDALWRYAMGLPTGGRTPTEKTLREVEAWLLRDHEDSGLTRKQALFEHVVHLALWSATTRGHRQPVWVMDSTPMWCFGAVLDTVRLLGDGLRRLGRLWARATGETLGAVARTWHLPLLLAPSTKGALRIDWRDRAARSEVVGGLVADVMRVVGIVGQRLPEVANRNWVQRQAGTLCDLLLRVVEQDLEQDDAGRWQIAQRVARDRLVSLTDPEARHGHKTRSESFWGHKINVLGDITSSVVAAVSVTAGNGHDAAPGHALVAEAQRMRIEIRRVLADTAYGGIESRLRLRSLGVELVAPPPGNTREGELFSKNEFDVDFERGVATCPNGVATSEREPTRSAEPKMAFRWPGTVCAACPVRQQCIATPKPRSSKNGKPVGRPPTGAGRRLVLDRLDRERREARAVWADPAIREEYRQRSIGERFGAILVRHGARVARSRGRAAADLQVHLIAIEVNLGILARNLAEAAAVAKSSAVSASAARARRPRAAAAGSARALPLRLRRRPTP